MNCAFCRIVADEVEAEVVWRSEDAIAFLDHRPLFPGHVLLIPTGHIATLADLPAPQVGPLFQIAQRLERGAVVETTGRQAGETATDQSDRQDEADRHDQRGTGITMLRTRTLSVHGVITVICMVTDGPDGTGTVSHVATLIGGTGADVVTLATALSNASVDLGDGSDTLALSNSANAATIE